MTTTPSRGSGTEAQMIAIEYQDGVLVAVDEGSKNAPSERLVVESNWVVTAKNAPTAGLIQQALGTGEDALESLVARAASAAPPASDTPEDILIVSYVSYYDDAGLTEYGETYGYIGIEPCRWQRTLNARGFPALNLSEAFVQSTVENGHVELVYVGDRPETVAELTVRGTLPGNLKARDPNFVDLTKMSAQHAARYACKMFHGPHCNMSAGHTFTAALVTEGRARIESFS